MCKLVRNAELAMGDSKYYLTNSQMIEKHFARSLFVSENIKAGERITEKNIKSVRPNDGMHTRFYEDVIGKVVRCDLTKGTPLKWDYLEGE